MVESDNDIPKISPNEGENDGADKDDGGLSQDDTQLVLVSKDLPDRIFLLPAGPKPVFPGMLFPLLVAAGPGAELLKSVARDVPGHMVGFVMTREATEGAPADGARRFHKIGTAARILKLQESEQGAVQALFQGEKRFEVLKTIERDKRIMAQVLYLEDTKSAGDDIKALGLAIINSMRDLIKNNPLFSEEIKMFLSRTDWGDTGRLADFAVTMTSSSCAELQDVLECLDVRKRLEKVLFLLRKELDINQLKEKITHQIEEKITQQQREFFLREQLKAIKQELGMEKDDKQEELDKLAGRVKDVELPPEARARINEE
ncbi:MAG: LON peptidase substrate-binding domain-containing protein, partial [Microthrixaceae bacterium]|nr:LON peptidase substrate-binding domain-containing protein [Microthrixaceae bacterium]